MVKSFIEVADNLERAISAVPMAELEAAEQVSAERAMTLLKQLRDGVVMTEGILLKVGGGGGSRGQGLLKGRGAGRGLSGCRDGAWIGSEVLGVAL